MNMEVLPALVAYGVVASITPGPNNLMLMTSGVNFGYGRTMPHLWGVMIGFAVMVMLIGLGLGGLFKAYPPLYAVVKYAGALYMLFLAWKIANAGPISGDPEARGRPLSFLQAAAFQWINPKAWAMAVTAVTAYLIVADPTWNAPVVAAILFAVGTPCSIVWIVFGVAMRRILSDPGHVRVFNWTMALLLVLSLWPVAREWL